MAAKQAIVELVEEGIKKVSNRVVGIQNAREEKVEDRLEKRDLSV